MNKKYKEIEFPAGCTIENAVSMLLVCQNKGILTWGTYNDIMLYSDTVTIDKAYIDITGMTKIQFEEYIREWEESYEQKEKEYQVKVPELTEDWIKKGRAILTNDRWEIWDKLVSISLRHLYHGKELGCCLDIVKALNNSVTLEDAKEMIKSQYHSRTSYNLVRLMVKKLHTKGHEFARYVSY